MRLCHRRRFPPLGLHKGILNFPCLLILLIHTKHKTIRSYFGQTPRLNFLEGQLIHLGDKAKNVRLIIGQMPKKAGWWDASHAQRDFSRSNKHYGKCVLSCLWSFWGGLRSKWCCSRKESRFVATHQGLISAGLQSVLNKTFCYTQPRPHNN